MFLKDKTVLITGGTGGLGQVVARAFAAQGANVAVTYLVEDELRRLPSDVRSAVTAIYADVTDEENVVVLFQRVIKQYNAVDILINIVGGFIPKTPIVDTRTKDWDHMMNMNLRSAFLCAREFLKLAKGRPYGRIISMAAMPALRPTAGRAAYAVSKNGIVALTQVLGEELKGTGITANAIAPSIIKTQSNVDSMPEENHRKWVAPEEIAEMILFLCSENGRSINGVTIPMFGGI